MLAPILAELHLEAPDRVVDVEFAALDAGSVEPVHQATTGWSVWVEGLPEVDFLLARALADYDVLGIE